MSRKASRKKGGKKFAGQKSRLDSRESEEPIKQGSASHFYFYNLVYGL